MYHGGEVYSELIHVPLVIRGPFAPAYRGHLVFREVETLSLARTIAGIAGADGRAFGGENLLEIPKQKEEPRFAFSEGSYGQHTGGRTRAVVHQGWKLLRRLRTGQYELYHMLTDPQEKQDLWAHTRPEVASRRKRLQAALEEFAKTRHPVAPVGHSELSPEAEARLRTLGYIE
jgi:arylsulfatase A-like enzyme